MADDHVAELALEAGGQLVEAVQREGEHVGDLVEPAVVGIQRLHLALAHECDAERARTGHSLGLEHRDHEVAQGALLDACRIGSLDRQVEGRGRHLADRSRCSARSL